MTRLALTGRIRFLCADPERIERQLAGTDLTLAEAGELRHEVSTDEITPVRVLTYYDERLGRYPYVELRADLSPERRQRGAVHVHRLRPDRSHPSR